MSPSFLVFSGAVQHAQHADGLWGRAAAPEVGEELEDDDAEVEDEEEEEEEEEAEKDEESGKDAEEWPFVRCHAIMSYDISMSRLGFWVSDFLPNFVAGCGPGSATCANESSGQTPSLRVAEAGGTSCCASAAEAKTALRQRRIACEEKWRTGKRGEW